MSDDDSGESEVEAFTVDRGPNRDEMVSSFLPESDDWDAKTILDLEDPSAVSALRQFDQLFPEVDDLQPVIDEFLEDFLKTRTSVAGTGRSEYVDILKSMYGSNDENNAASALAEAFGAGDDDT